MRKTKKVAIKHKRIIFYFNELGKYKIDVNETLHFMSYIFGVNDNYIIEIIKGYRSNLDKLKAVELEYRDVDTATIKAFVSQLLKKAGK